MNNAKINYVSELITTKYYFTFYVMLNSIDSMHYFIIESRLLFYH